jgi:hypothetical protein
MLSVRIAGTVEALGSIVSAISELSLAWAAGGRAANISP